MKLRKFAFFSYHNFIRCDQISRAWHFLNQSQWWEADRIEGYQHKKIEDLLHHAYNNVPYYGEVMRKAGISQSELKNYQCLKHLPLLDKGIIRENYSRLCSDNISQYQTKESSTSGSTGESLFFLVDETNGKCRRVSTFRNFEWCGISPFDRQALLWGARFDEPSRKNISDRIKLWTRPVLFLSSYDLSESTMADYVKQLQAFRPKLFISYPSPMERFAEFCMDRKVYLPALKAIICSAEQLFDHQRKTIEKAFGVPVFNRYGCREFGDLAQECDEHNGLHVNVERAYVEILDENGSPCPPENLGELVITDLENYAMPFIRYRIGDMAAWSNHTCPCGRGLPLLERIEGRAFDLIKTKSGQYLSGTFWTLLLRHISQNIVSFQVRQERIDKIEILLKTMSGKLSEASEQTLRYGIADKAPNLQVNIKYVHEIPLTKSGKRRFVVSSV